MIQGKAYNVKGINGIYTPTLFDMRRLEHGTEYLAGDDKELERDEIVLNRPDICAVIPMEDFCNMGLDASIYHITFSEPLTEKQRAEIEQLMADELGLMEFTPVTEFYEVSAITQWSDFAIYFIAVVAGLINIISLFAYFIRNNKRQYEIYKLMGASNGKITVIIFSELFAFAALGYVISLAGAIPIINNSDIFEKASIPSVLALIVIFMLIYLAAVLMCVGQIRNITLGKRNRHAKKKKQHLRPRAVRSAADLYIF